MRTEKGFSLIELLIVVAIILIIAAIAIPKFLQSRMASNEASAIVARQLHLAGVNLRPGENVEYILTGKRKDAKSGLLMRMRHQPLWGERNHADFFSSPLRFGFIT